MTTPSASQFSQLHTYNFSQDAEFANGLAIILGHPETPASEAEMNREDDLVLQAKCFFFSRKANVSPPISFAAYKAWLASLTGQESDTGVSQAGESASLESDKHTPASTSASASSEPAYPTSFAHIVELITTGQPIPGIEEIPDTVLEGHDLVTEKPRRRKPWEKDEIVAPAGVDETETETTTSAV